VAWNHNLHYHPVVLAAVPERCERALDVGCGEGVLARRLPGHVVGIDADATCIDLARRAGGADYVHGDFMTHPFEPGSFDFIACVAALHHMDERAALRRMATLLRPGGALAVIGLARSRPGPRDLAAIAVNRAHRLRKEWFRSPAPVVWPPPHTYREVRAIAREELPGARFRRHLLWRYSVVWTAA
jgi:SAM-dependent methyltransferase